MHWLKINENILKKKNKKAVKEYKSCTRIETTDAEWHELGIRVIKIVLNRSVLFIAPKGALNTDLSKE